jgi:thiol-disulfide isomerase/thioredoxin
VYDPVASATNIPIMLYQGGKRGNRWQLDTTLEKLQAGGAPVHLKIMPGVTGLFYEEDIASETFDMLREIPAEIARTIPILAKTPTPVTAAPIANIQQAQQKNLDLSLQPFKGQMSPLVIDLMSVNGKPFKRKSYDGKVTVINFWASWCGPCVEEIPALNRLRQSMLGKPFELISINYAEKPEQILEFMQLVDVDFPVLVDLDGQFSSNWNVLVYPATFVIGPDSRIAYGVNGAIEWDSPDVINQLNTLLPSVQ